VVTELLTFFDNCK